MSDGAQNRKSNAAFHFAAGLGSGIVSAFLLQPADLLKTRVQQTHAASLSQALRDVLLRDHPLRQLWRGTVPSVIRTGAGSALYFGFLNQMRQYVARRTQAPTAAIPAGLGPQPSALPKLSNTANLATGALARVLAGLILNPVTVLKVRYESSQFASYTSLAAAASHILRSEGPRGFFAGFGATAVRDAPYAGLYVVLYEQAKTRLEPVLGRGAGTRDGGGATATATATAAVTVNFVSGVVAAVSATTLTNPFDAIKTRLQLRPALYGNMLRAAGMMLRQEGWRSMFGGLGLRIARKAVSSALTWTVYEEVIRRVERGLV